MKQKCLSLYFSMISAIFLLVCLPLNTKADSIPSEFDPTGYINVNTSQDVIKLLLNARKEHEDVVIIRANPSQVKIENDRPGYVDLDVSINKYISYLYNGGLYSSIEYDVFAGPYVDQMMPDASSPGYNFYKIAYEYHDNDEELAASDVKLREIMATSKSSSAGDRLTTLYNWMKVNLPASKDSDKGYPRNCNGIYGCLFGDGTGFCCSTYAVTIQRYCELAGINGYVISGNTSKGEINHAFNVVEINNQWYIIDYAFSELLTGLESYEGTPEYKTLFKRYMKGYKIAELNYGHDDGNEANPGPVDDKQKPTSLSKLKADQNSITVKWKKATTSGIKGYQIQYSTNKKFKKNTQTVNVNKVKTTTIKGLKSKTKYYVRIRTFRKKDGEKIYSPWSKTKSVKTK